MELRALKEKDAVGMLEWMQDPEVNCFFRFDEKAITNKSVIDFIAASNINENRKKNLHLAIVDDQDEYLGTISLKNIDDAVKSAEYSIGIRRAAQGQGVGSTATKKILQIAFEELALNRVYLNVISDNIVAIKMYEKIGFQFEGKFRNHIMIHGVIKSLSWYAVLREEFIIIKSGETHEIG